MLSERLNSAFQFDFPTFMKDWKDIWLNFGFKFRKRMEQILNFCSGIQIHAKRIKVMILFDLEADKLINAKFWSI